MAGFRAYGQHGYRTGSMFYFDRSDMWDKNFRHRNALIAGGAYLRTGDASFNSYIGYNFVSTQPFDSYLNWAVAGARKVLNPVFAVYTEAGYFWHSGAGPDDRGWLGLVGAQHRIGPLTVQAAEVGRRVYKPFNAAPGVEEFAEYRISHQLGMRTSIVGVAGISERYVMSAIENDYTMKYAGLMLQSQLALRLSAYASAGWEEAEMEATSTIFERWLYRLGLNYWMTENIQSQCYYQYEDVHGNNINYTEHFLYLGVSKRF
jgi:hypothetical protein